MDYTLFGLDWYVFARLLILQYLYCVFKRTFHCKSVPLVVFILWNLPSEFKLSWIVDVMESDENELFNDCIDFGF